MQKVYLEKRTTDECDTIDTNVTSDTRPVLTRRTRKLKQLH